MSNIPIPAAVCSIVGDLYASSGSHETLDEIFREAGAPGDPPNLPHHTKWKTWLKRAGNDKGVDSLAVLGQLIEEFMDVVPERGTLHFDSWQKKRASLVQALAESGFEYFRGGRVLPKGSSAGEYAIETSEDVTDDHGRPVSVEELLQILIRGLPRAMHPLAHRRKGLAALSFSSEYDLQDLLHALLRPWVADIRPEEHTPSYAGSSTRMDFLLHSYNLVLETKRIRDPRHGRDVGKELILDIEHYRGHPKCRKLWCIIYDPEHLVPNPSGLTKDLNGTRSSSDGEVDVSVFIISGGTE